MLLPADEQRSQTIATASTTTTKLSYGLICYYYLLAISCLGQTAGALKPAASVDHQHHHHHLHQSTAIAKQTTSSSSSSSSEICLARVSQLDRCLPKLVVYGDRQFEPPKSEQQLDKHCAELNDNMGCIGSYSRECLPPVARNFYSVMLKRLRTQYARRCKAKDGRRDFINLMACGDLQYMEPAHKCMDSFIAQLEHIDFGDPSRQVQLICCTFQLFTECIFSVARRMDCPHRVVSAEKSIEYVRSIINTMGGDLMDMMCGKYNSLVACSSDHASKMASFKSITERVANGTLAPQSRSPLKPMLQLLVDTLEQD